MQQKKHLKTFATTLLAFALISPIAGTQEAASGGRPAPVHCTTYHYDNARLGWNSREALLKANTVNPDNFAKLWQQPLDGRVPGSPLQVSSMIVGGKNRDVVFAATEHNSVYALDAATGQVLWSRRQLAPPISEAEFNGSWGRNVHGVLSTPVIDLESGTLYVCGLTRRGLRQHHVVWALDILTGKTRAGWPQTVRGTFRGKSTSKAFVTGEVMQRGALSLVNGRLLIPFGGRGDAPPWRGWVVAFNTRKPQETPQLFCTSPVGDGGGVWSAGGVSASTTGEIFGVTGNGEYDLIRGGDHLGQTIFRLKMTPSRLAFSPQKANFFTPENYQHLNDQDEDLGGASALVLPELPGAKTPRLLFTGGKDGFGFLLNRDNLGGLGGQLQKMRLFGDPKAIYNEGIRATSAYFDGGSKGRFIFVPGDQPGPEERKSLVALRLFTDTNGNARYEQAWTLKDVLERPSSPVVSSWGEQDAIVWTTETDGRTKPNASLRAYDALTGNPIYDSDTAGLSSRLDYASRFVSPTVLNGRVLVSGNGVSCYGLLPRKTAAGSTVE